MLQINFNINTY